MNRALVIKELRETAALAGLAALAMAWWFGVLWGVELVPWSSGRAVDMPFRDDNFPMSVGMICWALAVGLALKQTQWEDVKGTYYYLLHRPLPRRRVLLLKAAVGLTLVMTMGAVMIVLHGLWAAKPGNHASPFFWSMTAESWRAWTTLPVVYAAAALAGVRPSRWFGSRLLPLAGGALLAFFLTVQPWFWISAVGSVLGTAFYGGTAIHVAATRDY